MKLRTACMTTSALCISSFLVCAVSIAQSTDELLSSCRAALTGANFDRLPTDANVSNRELSSVQSKGQICVSYFEGIADGFGLADALLIGKRVDGVCVPQELRGAHLAASFVRWSDQNPKLIFLPRDRAVISALIQTFQCR